MYRTVLLHHPHLTVAMGRSMSKGSWLLEFLLDQLVGYLECLYAIIRQCDLGSASLRIILRFHSGDGTGEFVQDGIYLSFRFLQIIL